MVPRLSAPAITSARRTPGIGCSTTVVTADSHWPAIPLTSSLCLRTSASISGLFPMVPMITTSSPAGAPVLTTGASCPVTRPTSWLKSPTALTTPGQSSPLTTSVAACPFAASTKSPGAGDVLTYFGSPKALAAAGHCAIAKKTRTAVPAVLKRDIDKLRMRILGDAVSAENKPATPPWLMFSPQPDYSLDLHPQWRAAPTIGYGNQQPVDLLTCCFAPSLPASLASSANPANSARACY